MRVKQTTKMTKAEEKRKMRKDQRKEQKIEKLYCIGEQGREQKIERKKHIARQTIGNKVYTQVTSTGENVKRMAQSTIQHKNITNP